MPLDRLWLFTLNRVYNFAQVCPKQGIQFRASPVSTSFVLNKVIKSRVLSYSGSGFQTFGSLTYTQILVEYPLASPSPTTPAGTLGTSGFSCVWQWSTVEMFWVSRWLVYLQPKAEAMSSQGTNLLTSIHPTLTFYYLYLLVWLDVSHMLFLSECQAVVQVKFQYWSLKCVEMGTLVVSDQVANPYVQKNSV